MNHAAAIVGRSAPSLLLHREEVLGSRRTDCTSPRATATLPRFDGFPDFGSAISIRAAPSRMIPSLAAVRRAGLKAPAPSRCWKRHTHLRAAWCRFDPLMALDPNPDKRAAPPSRHFQIVTTRSAPPPGALCPDRHHLGCDRSASPTASMLSATMFCFATFTFVRRHVRRQVLFLPINSRAA